LPCQQPIHRPKILIPTFSSHKKHWEEKKKENNAKKRSTRASLHADGEEMDLNPKRVILENSPFKKVKKKEQKRKRRKAKHSANRQNPRGEERTKKSAPLRGTHP